MKRLLGVTIALALTAPAAARDDHLYGPVPEWPRYKELVEPAALAKTADPGNWTVEWWTGFTPLGWRHKGKHHGYFSCHRLRAKTPVNGRSVVNFVALVDHDTVQFIDISTRERNSLVNVFCDALISRGVLPPLPQTPAGSPAPAAINSAALGLKLQAMPQGAYVSEVQTGGAGQAAGIVPGMVIASVNGIALAGLGDAMGKLLDNGADLMKLETVTGERFEVRRAG